MRRYCDDQAGFATWEAIGLVPFYALIVLIIIQVSMAPLTAFRAEVAAWSAARAVVRGNDPTMAAREVAGGQLKDVVVNTPVGCRQTVTVVLEMPAVLTFMQAVLPDVDAAFTLPDGALC